MRVKRTGEHPVSDHALVRFLERVHGVDMDEFRDLCLEECREWLNLGVSHAEIDGHCYVFRGGSVVTILESGAHPYSVDARRLRRHKKEIEREAHYYEDYGDYDA